MCYDSAQRQTVAEKKKPARMQGRTKTMKKVLALLLAILMMLPFGAATAEPERAYSFPVLLWSEDSVRGFVASCYVVGLGREADEGGLDGWTNLILSGDMTLEAVVRFLLCSDEVAYRKLSDEDYVRVLYTVYLQRDADADGLAAWAGKLGSGTGRDALLDIFAQTPEFEQLKQDLSVGTWEETDLFKTIYFKKDRTPASYMGTEADQAKMAATLFMEANREISENLDSDMDRMVYTGLDKNDYGFAAFPLARGDGYRVYCWKSGTVADWGNYTDEQVPALLRMMKEVYPIDIFVFQDVLDGVRAEVFK